MTNNPQFIGVQLPIGGSMDPPRSFLPAVSMQLPPLVQAQQSQWFTTVQPKQFHPIHQTINMGLPTPSPQFQFSQSQPVPARPTQPGHGPLQSQEIPMPMVPPNRLIVPGPPPSQYIGNHEPALGGTGAPLSSSYTFAPASYGQMGINSSSATPSQALPQVPQVPQAPQVHGPQLHVLQVQAPEAHAPSFPAGVQPRLLSESLSKSSVVPVQETGEQPSVRGVMVPAASLQDNPPAKAPSDWAEHTFAGRRYYYNKRTRQSSWVKPLELMTPIERADATTDWKEFVSPVGRSYYYNKLTKESRWILPDELKVARELVGNTFTKGTHLEMSVTSHASDSIPLSVVTPFAAAAPSSTTHGLASRPVRVEPVFAAVHKQPAVVSGSSTFSFPVSIVVTDAAIPPVASGSSALLCLPSKIITNAVDPAKVSGSLALSVAASVTKTNAAGPAVVSESSAVHVAPSTVKTDAVGVQSPVKQVASFVAISESVEVPVILGNSILAPSNFNHPLSQDVLNSGCGVSEQKIEENKAGIGISGKINSMALAGKAVEPEPLIYANKLEAKKAFKALLKSADVGPDWTWDQVMRVIINDRRYGALKTLGEKKQTFNEFLGQWKKQEHEERRVKQKKAREEFKKMLEESTELTSWTRWSKAIKMFEDDERFEAVERARDREDLFENYLLELEKKEQEKTVKEHKRNVVEYRKFLESCDFIKASSQWREVKDWLQADERCSHLERIQCLEIFEDYIRDLEEEEEEKRKIQKEELRKVERKNRDEFRKLMEEHVTAGSLTAKTHWRDYYMTVKDLPSYLAVASNTSGSTPKELFEDVSEELQEQYREDLTRINDAIKFGKIPLSSTWTFENFRAAISEDASFPKISDINLNLLFEELLGRVQVKEEKGAKKRKRLAEEFFNLLCSIKEITGSSEWEECKSLFEDSWTSEEESFHKEIFGEYIRQLKQRVKEEQKQKEEMEIKERDKRKAKQKREKASEKRLDEESKRSDKDKKRWKRHQSAVDDLSLDKKGKHKSKYSSKSSSDSKRSRQMKEM